MVITTITNRIIIIIIIMNFLRDERRTRKIDLDNFPIVLLTLQGVKKSKIWPRFSTAVAFGSDTATYRTSKTYTRSADDLAKYWLVNSAYAYFLPTSQGVKTAKFIHM